jgi:ribose transport system permease protein
VAVGFLVTLALALTCGAINGAVSIFLGLPSIVTSLFLMFFFTGAQYLLMESTGENTIKLLQTVKPADRNTYTLMLIGIIALLAVIGTYFFNYTKLGKYTRAIGANKVAAKQSGISLVKWQVMGYMALGFCAAVASFVLLTRTGTAGKGTGSGYAMDIMICLILGGMPLKGGMKSRLSCAVIGSLTFSLLAVGLPIIGVPTNMTFLIKAVIFLVVVLITCRQKGGALPR